MIEQTTATASEWDDCYRGRFFLGGKRLPPSLSAMDSFSVFNRELAFRGGLKPLQPRFRDFAVKTSSGRFLFLDSDLQFGCVEHNVCAVLCGF